MSNKNNAINQIISDLKLLFSKEEILPNEIEDILLQVQSEEVKSYIKSLSEGSKPESALRESFFAGKSVLSKYLFKEISPEIYIGEGFIDYLIKAEYNRFIPLELKSLFEAEFETIQGNRILKKLKPIKLDLDKHKSQILKYLQKGSEYIILTNLKEWYFFNKTCAPDEYNYFHSTNLFDFIKDYDVQENLLDYLERKEFESIRGDLDKRFFQSLNAWVKKLSEVDFTVDGNKKTELIIGLLNKFIFVQTLDDYGVINFQWLKSKWEAEHRDWITKGKQRVLKEFFRKVDTWFYEYYDTELFKEDILNYIKDIDLFYRNLQLVLGLTYWQTSLGGFRGILQYKFKYIDEDIFGKAYETFLAEIRKEQGIYYTPSYITEYIVENTVGKIFEEMVIKIKKELELENFSSIQELIHKFLAIKVIDPACGSGSFLIKALRLIFKKYKELLDAILAKEKEYSKFNNTLTRAKEDEKKVQQILQLKQILTFQPIELIPRIIIRHIYGNDLDKKALEVAKVNLWLKCIKLYPKGFRFDRLPENTNHILPDLEMNLCNGDSLVGLPEDLTLEYLHNRHKKEIIKLFELRNKYLDNPTNPELVEEIENIKSGLRKELDLEFKKYLEENKLSLEILKETKPFHWALEFWYVFFKENGESLSVQERGFDAVVGNPPWISFGLRGTEKLPQDLQEYLRLTYPNSMEYKGSIYAIFMNLGISKLKNRGIFSFILPDSFLLGRYFSRLRRYILDTCNIKEISLILRDFWPDGSVGRSVIINLQKENKELESRNNKLKAVLYEEVEDIIEKGYISSYSYEQDYFENIIHNRFRLFFEEKSKNFVENMEEKGIKLGSRVSIHTGVRSKIGQKNIISKTKKGTTWKRGLISGSEIDRYSLKYEGHFLNIEPSILWSGGWDPNVVLNNKLLLRQTGDSLIATLDDTKYYHLNNLHSIAPKNNQYNLKYILALLNSKLLNHYYHLISIELGRAMAQTDIETIEQLPIYPATPDQQKPIIELVDKIINLKKSRDQLIAKWNEWSTILKNNEYTLHKILEEDANHLRTGTFDKTWTLSATFYPNSENELLNQDFKKFKVIGDNEKSILKIYGLDEQNKEELIYEMKFYKREIMQHIYFSIIALLGSRKKVKSLKALFAKTVIPIIQPDVIINTANIIKKVEEELQYIDIVHIDNSIEDIDAQIDALVFKLYGLTEEEVKVVMESLNVQGLYMQKVLEYFNKNNNNILIETMDYKIG